MHLIVVDKFDPVWRFFFAILVRGQIFKSLLQSIGMVQQSGQGVRSLACRRLLVAICPDLLHKVAAALQHILQQLKPHVGEMSVLAIFISLTQFLLDRAPASQRLDRNPQPLFHQLEVAVIFIEQVQRFDFCIEAVVPWHFGCSFSYSASNTK